MEIEFQDEDCLVEALKEIGYQPRVSQTAVALEGYQGDKRNQKAHIILPRSQVGSASNDIGFERKEDGKWIAHVSAYDTTNWKRKEQQLKQLYAKNVIVKQGKKAKFSIKSQTTEADGSIHIRMKVRR